MCNPRQAEVVLAAREGLRKHNLCLPIRIKENIFLSEEVNIARLVKLGIQYFSCNWLRAYCTGTSYVGNFQTFDSGRTQKKYGVVRSTIPLSLPFF
jgi:hypothetical protein